MTTESAERESQIRIASRVPTVTNSAGALTEKHTYHPLRWLRMMMNQRLESVARETVRSFASRKLTAMSSDIASQEMILHFLLSLLRKKMTTQISRHVENWTLSEYATLKLTVMSSDIASQALLLSQIPLLLRIVMSQWSENVAREK